MWKATEEKNLKNKVFCLKKMIEGRNKKVAEGYEKHIPKTLKFQ